jgi:hypothetical protein
MKPQSIRDTILALLALLVALAATYWFGYLLFLLVEQAHETSDRTFVFWLPALAQMALAVGLVALVWWLATRANYPRAIDVIFVLAGVAVLFLAPATFALQVNISSFVVVDSGPVSFWTMTGAMLAAAGLFHLFWRRPPTG